MIPQLDTYDWQEAFRAASGPEAAKPGSSVTLTAFGADDVASVIASSEGANDEANWLIAGKLKDGRFFYLSAGCDYTGWDCQCWGRSWVASRKADLLNYGIPADEQKQLGLEEVTK